MTPNPILQISSILGLAISLYFLGVYKGIIKGRKNFVPDVVCNDNTCISILKTKYSNPFKIPNFILGIFYYIIVLISTFLIFSASNLFLFLLSWFVVIFSFYLAYALIFKLKTICVLCFASHVINIIIAVVYTIMFFS